MLQTAPILKADVPMDALNWVFGGRSRQTPLVAHPLAPAGQHPAVRATQARVEGLAAHGADAVPARQGCGPGSPAAGPAWADGGPGRFPPGETMPVKNHSAQEVTAQCPIPGACGLFSGKPLRRRRALTRRLILVVMVGPRRSHAWQYIRKRRVIPRRVLSIASLPPARWRPHLRVLGPSPGHPILGITVAVVGRFVMTGREALRRRSR